jgi:hypothetical protein
MPADRRSVGHRRRVTSEIILTQPADEPIEFTGGIRAIVAALACFTFALVAEEWIDEIRDDRSLLAVMCWRQAGVFLMHDRYRNQPRFI